jgi:drug/metabolite transporter (DMT)-like permease
MSGKQAPASGGGNIGYVALIPVLGLMWGLNWPAVKIVLGEIAPWTFRATGLLLGGLLLVGIARLAGRSLTVPREHWPRLIVAAIFSIAGFNVLLAFAQIAAPTSRAAIVAYTMPIWAVLFARIGLGERLDRQRVIGLTLGAAGLAALGWPLVRDGQFSIGLLYALAGGASWAAGTVTMKRFPVADPTLSIAGWQLLIGGACAAVGMFIFEGVPTPKPLGLEVTLALTYHVLLAQAAAYVIWFEVVPRLPAGISSLGTLMVPAVGVSGAMLFLGERPTLMDYLGLVLIVSAAASVLLPSRAARVAVSAAPSSAAKAVQK